MRLWDESQGLPRKQRYTARKIYQAVAGAGYPGSEITISRYVAEKRRESLPKQVYLPLEFDPGQDAQVDWGEAVVEIGARTAGRATAHHASELLARPLRDGLPVPEARGVFRRAHPGLPFLRRRAPPHHL